MTISTRTPEGFPNGCPVCGAEVCVEPSQPSGDAPCPRCGTLLWFANTSAGSQVYEAEEVAPLKERIAEIICGQLGVRSAGPFSSAAFVEEVGIGSLDIVELVMEVEEEFDIAIPDEDVEKIESFGDIVGYILQRRSP